MKKGRNSMKKRQLMTIIIAFFSMFYGSYSYAYLIEWQSAAIDNTSSRANNIFIPGVFDAGNNSASGSSAAGYANAESTFATSNAGFDLFADVEVGIDQSGWFNANSNSNFSGSFIIRAESGEASSSSTLLTVDINRFFETDILGSEPVFEINGNDLGFDSSLSTNALIFDFNIDTLYTTYAYGYAVISDFFDATDTTSTYNRQGEMNVAFNFKNPATAVPNPGAFLLFGLGLILLQRKSLEKIKYLISDKFDRIRVYTQSV